LVNPTNNNGGNGSFHVVFGSRQNKGPVNCWVVF